MQSCGSKGNTVTHPDVKRISFSRIKNPDNTYSWDCKSQRQFAPFITIIEGISERTRYIRKDEGGLLSHKLKLNSFE